MSVAHAHMCGVTPNPPYPHKKFEGPNPIGSRDMAHSNFHESLGVVVGGVWCQTPPPTITTPKLQLDSLSQKSQVEV